VFFQNVLPRYGEALLRLFYPSLCANCESLLELQESGLCVPCRGALEALRLLPSEERIRLSFRYGHEGWALFRYDGVVKEIFHKIKFEKRRDLLRVFSNEISRFLARRPRLAEYDCIVAVPLDLGRRLEREFNQSQMIATKVQEILGVKREKSLVKKRSTPPQSLLGREERRLNLSGVFSVSLPRRMRGKSVLLVDDIFTTGATLEEAAKTLKAAGAGRVGYFVLARAFGN